MREEYLETMMLQRPRKETISRTKRLPGTGKCSSPIFPEPNQNHN